MINKVFGVKDDRGYGQLYKPSEALDIRTRRRARYMIEKMKEKSGGQVLEIGCGNGKIARMLAEETGNQITGSDLCAPFIEEAKKGATFPNLSFMVLDFNHPEPLKGKKFDTIVGNGILHHLVENLEGALTSIRQLLVPGGRIVFLEPSLVNPLVWFMFGTRAGRQMSKLEPTEMAFTKGYITQKLLAAGFTDISVEHKDFLLPFVPRFLIRPVIFIGSILEKVPLLKFGAQSIFISAKNP